VKLDSQIDLDLGRFFRWWGGELAFLVPPKLLKMLGGAPDYLLLSRSDQGVAVQHLGPSGERELGQFGLNETGAQAREQLFKESPDLEEARVVLRLEMGQALRKSVKLPAAAEENLNQVVAFEMDRLTPFKSEQVYFSAKVVERLPATKQIAVDLILTPRNKLDAMLDELAGAGWKPDIVDLTGAPPTMHCNLLPEKYRPPRNRWLYAANIALGAAIGLLLLAVLILPVLFARSEAQALEEQTRKATKTAKEVESLRQQMDTLLHQTRFLIEKKRTTPIMVDALDELSRVIPDNTWLHGLQYKDNRVVIQGQSPSASRLIELIEASPHYKNTSFVSPVTKDVSSGMERFQIASDVVNGRFSENSAPQAPAPEQPDSGQ
jgi:general secretion pathway protein L